MVAVDEANGNAFLVGRESRDMAWVDLKKGRVALHSLEREGGESRRTSTRRRRRPSARSSATALARTVLAVDGTTATLHRFDADSGKLLERRALALQPGGRWHFAGYGAQRRELVLVVETAERKVIQAAKIAAAGGRDVVVPLPGFTEGVGIRYDEGRDELYIPYDNHPSLHIVDFKDNGRLSEVKLPAYGNDATALDAARDLLYVSSWAYGEIDQVDLGARRLRRRFFQAAVLPHMFNMAFNPNDGTLYLPLGATAVNGSFGAAVTAFDPGERGRREDAHRLGAAGAAAAARQRRLPGLRQRGPHGAHRARRRRSPPPSCPCPTRTRRWPRPAGNVYLSYGPHQSYWPVVYIWAARDGILGIDGKDLSFYDRRIPRLAQAMALSPAGALYALQNNWGDEKQFYVTLGDEVRSPNQGDMRVELEDTVSRETSQRLVAYDADSRLAARGPGRGKGRRPRHPAGRRRQDGKDAAAPGGRGHADGAGRRREKYLRGQF